MFNFLWKPQRAPKAPPPVAQPVVVQEAPEPVELYTAEGRITAHIATGGERMSDILNRGGSVRLLWPGFSPYLDGGLPSDVPWWFAMELERVDLAIPPPHVSPSHLRRHLRQRPVEIHVGPFIVTGNVHVPPTASEVAHFVLQRRLYFLPLTAVAISHLQEPRFNREADVVLVNTAAIQGIRDSVLA